MKTVESVVNFKEQKELELDLAKREALKLSEEIYKIEKLLKENQRNFSLVRVKVLEPFLLELQQKHGNYYKQDMIDGFLASNDIFQRWLKNLNEMESLLNYKRNLLAINMKYN